MNPIQLKIKRTSKVVAVFAKILYITLIVAVCVELTGIIWQALAPDSGSFMLGTLRVLSPIANQGHLTADEMAKLFAGVINYGFLTTVVVLVYLIFRDISRDTTPFSTKHTKKMRRIGRLLIIDSLVVPIAEAGISKTLGGTAQVTYDFSGELIVLGLILYCFALFFEYGAQLQQQSDETL